MILRYIAHTDDDTELGAAALVYADWMYAMGFTFRLVSTTGWDAQLPDGRPSRWAKHSASLLTPIHDHPYINVVCAAHDTWKRWHAAKAHKNVLLWPFAPPITSRPPMDVGMGYDVVVCANDADWVLWRDYSGKMATVVTSPADLRPLLLPKEQ